ncbi:hypothetical protein N7461_001693 [Penicillium sp. DV-2018c]|nr:hypothetical protein N7461_001693 [Penicillium sp. DV-2018c]
MKFAKELEQELVPEWRAKYLDYKLGKKKVKAITRALQKAHRSPNFPSQRQNAPQIRGAIYSSPNIAKHLDAAEQGAPLTPHRRSTERPSTTRSTPGLRTERQPLRTPRTPGSRFSENIGSYGSILATPPNRQRGGSDAASLELPDPALDPEDDYFQQHGEDMDHSSVVRSPSPVMNRHTTGHLNPAPSPAIADPSPDERPRSDPRGSYTSHMGGSLTKVPSSKRASQLLRRVFTAEEDTVTKRHLESSAGAELDKRQDEFFKFLDSELDKIDSFYVMKEQEATEKLRVLRQQLHIMRDQRIQEVLAAKRAAKSDHAEAQQRANGFAKINSSRLKGPFGGKNRFGKNSEALAEMATPGMHPQDREFIVNRRDFMRRQEPPNQEVSYRSAKHKLKNALQEFYRGVELLKGYAYLNRTAFRKINKKYDKVVNARPPLRYMSEKVNKASFVQSEVIESLMTAVEDLYARYFERGNRKIAVSKLRHTIKKSSDYSPNTFRSGLLLMGGALFSIKGLVDATSILRSDEGAEKIRTSYLLQIYGGYFLIVFHVLLFCLDCMIWTKSKINHAFVFEYDTRHTLEWRQLLEIPSLFFFMMGLFMWLNFSWYNHMYVYWPVVLIGLSVIIVFLPARILYHRSRKWFAFSNWRLLLAGIYPVEFRDFFLGDMYCSQTYAMGNIELFFCLYASHWGYPPKCNSSHSRLLGFFQTLPSIWRSFQCIRRYLDTKNAFPHLLNLGKYIFGVLFYATLSMYRIDLQTRFQASFITFALLNAVYTSVWDLIMDWSLGNPYAKNPMLREVLAFRRVWVYYAAMILDVVVRFNWIFYAIFIKNIQQSALLSFMVSLSEVCRRGIWSIFRVENEHCTNVLLFRASRDVPLPYVVASPSQALDGAPEGVQLQEQHAATPSVGAGDVEHGAPSVASTRARQRRPSVVMGRVGEIVASAHAQDFERRRLPSFLSNGSVGRDMARHDDDSTDEDDEGDMNTDDESGSQEGERSRPGSERRETMGPIVE